MVGGCFDILHPGHLVFLEKAKEQGDYLIVLLESDKKVRKLKGEGRPINPQKLRAKALSEQGFVDEVISLPYMEDPSEYDGLVAKIKPDIIAATAGYAHEDFLKRSAKLAGAKYKIVTNLVGNHSTTSVLEANLGARHKE